MKTCSRCGETKPLDGFYREKGRYRARCKECHKASVYARRDADPEGHAEYMAAWREEHREQLRERQAEYFAKNRDALNASRRAARAEDPERFRAQQREYWWANRERKLEQKAKYYEKYRDQIRARNDKWIEENRERYEAWRKAYRLATREEKREYNRHYYRENRSRYDLHSRRRRHRLRAVESDDYTRAEIYERDNGECRNCGMELPMEPGGFHIDHIVPVSLGGVDTRANVQLMCQPCNQEKRATLEGQIYLPV